MKFRGRNMNFILFATPEEQAEIKASYPQIFKRCEETLGGFLHDFVEQSALDASEEEREAFYEELWQQPGFSYWLGIYNDILTNEKANETASEFARKKIRERVNDPEVAELLAPKDHMFGTKRQPMESGYYEVFNQPNFHLVDIKTHPIKRLMKSPSHLNF